MAFGLPNISFIGYPVAAPCAGHAGLGLREARPRDAEAIRAHLLRLGPEDRRLRFCATLSDAALEARLDAPWRRGDVVLAAFDGPLWEGPFHAAGPVRALAELAVNGRDAEIGLSVDAGLRRRGLGVHLVRTAARVLAPRGVERLLAYTLPGNRAMLSLARASGAAVERGPDDVEIVFSVDALHRAYLRRRLAARVFLPVA